jgi:hypothetical protein
MTNLDVNKERKRIPRLASGLALRTAALMVRMTSAQRRAIERRAAMSGLSASAWLRMIALRELRDEENKK